MLKYLYSLYNQFIDSQGYKNIDINSSEFQSEFNEWLKIQQQCGEKYQKFLMLLDIPYDDINSIEVGKGKYDSIATTNNQCKIVTEYAMSFDDVSPRIINGKLNINNSGRPYAFVTNKSKRSHDFISFNSNLIYTQNVYNSDDLALFARLHNCGNCVLIGAYGKISDKDRLKKIERLRRIRKELLQYKEQYIFSGDDYIYFIQSKEKCLTKSKNRLKKETVI